MAKRGATIKDRFLSLLKVKIKLSHINFLMLVLVFGLLALSHTNTSDRLDTLDNQAMILDLKSNALAGRYLHLEAAVDYIDDFLAKVFSSI
jgi:hypothetical protein